jgi:homoserine dehydrogenase
VAGTLRFKPVAGFYCPTELNLLPEPPPVPRYLRLTVRDRPGIVARVAAAVARQSINIDSVMQEPGMDPEQLSFVMTIEPVTDRRLAAALAEIETMDFMLEPVLALRAD